LTGSGEKVCPVCGEGSPHLGGHWILHEGLRDYLRANGLIVEHAIPSVTPDRAGEIRRMFKPQ